MQQTFLKDSDNLPPLKRLRFVQAPNGSVWFDVDEKAPTEKSLYLPCGESFLKEALNADIKDYFAVNDVSALLEQVTQALKEKSVKALSLSKKAGLTGIGLEKVRETYQKGMISHIVLATDAGTDVSKRVKAWTDVQIFMLLTQDEISQALGGVNMSLVGLRNDPQSIKVVDVINRYQEFLKN